MVPNNLWSRFLGDGDRNISGAKVSFGDKPTSMASAGVCGGHTLGKVGCCNFILMLFYFLKIVWFMSHPPYLTKNLRAPA